MKENHDMQESSFFTRNQKFIYWVVAIVLIALIVVLLYKNRVSDRDIDDGSMNLASSTVSVVAFNQEAGSFVDVASVVAQDVSWVAVRENNNDVMGRILGAQKVTAGSHENVIVELLRNTAPNVMYAVVIYKDDGDDTFDFRTDELMMEDDGVTPVLSRFVTE